MRKSVLMLMSLFIALTVYAQQKVKHVVLIGCDGFGAYALPEADMPNLKNLMKDGSWSLKARSVLPSSSAVNWASMIMGAGPTLHGYTEWNSAVPEIPSSRSYKRRNVSFHFQYTKRAETFFDNSIDIQLAGD